MTTSLASLRKVVKKSAERICKKFQCGAHVSTVVRFCQPRYGIFNGMKSTMDSAGRLVIPKDIRREAGIRPGMPLDIRVREGRIEIEPAPLTVRLEKRGRFLVAVPQEQVPVLTTEAVEETRDKLRREREGR